jgi:hypothetical protein
MTSTYIIVHIVLFVSMVMFQLGDKYIFIHRLHDTDVKQYKLRDRVVFLAVSHPWKYPFKRNETKFKVYHRVPA